MSSEENKLNVQGYNIVTILKRLEAATSRLEDITMIQEDTRKPQEKSIANNMSNTSSVSSSSTSSGGSAPLTMNSVPKSIPEEDDEEEKTKSTIRFEEFIDDVVKPWAEQSKAIDTAVGESADQLYEAFKAQAEFLHIVSQAKKPQMTDPKFMEAVKPINEKIEKIGGIKDSNRQSKYFNHLNTITEGAPVLGWIVSDTPVSLIPEYKDSAQFWSNRIMKEYKDSDQTQVEWVKSFLGIFEPLKDYVKEFHTKGPKWNVNGKPLEEVLSKKSKSSAPAPPPSAAGGPPPPPPPPPANLFDDAPSSTSAAPAGGMNAVFADLNKGENITSGLKKVEKSQMNHKNPELKKAPAVPKKPTPPKKPSSLSSSSSVPTKKPARKELIDGSKWIIEHYTKADLQGEDLITIDAEMHQSIFVGNCKDITLQIKGKANAISVSNTSGCGIVIDSLISGIELIKAHKFGLQVLGTVADIDIDQCDEGSIYLSKECVEAETQIYSSKTTALNINVPKDDDYVELPAPEQFKHSIKNGKLVSEVVEHVA
ncbi:adenylyl cyclase-associated protein [[Candida] jaroonii]|uniref:Adenylyl cyclase-associated protein n=1 Tax=[Candida] jaroonii TaxID=467808 RepID=A0ACA9Y677_9ASCO|nr:adenylyl cyclase-associated protein [[Candida] jaroonii]